MATAPRKLPAATTARPPTQTVAQARASQTAAQQAAAQQAAAQQAAAQQAAAAARAREAAAAEQAKQKAAQTADLLNRIGAATSTAQLNALLSQAKTLGITVPTSTLNAGRANAVKAEQQKQAQEAEQARQFAAQQAAEEQARQQKAAADRAAADRAAADRAAAEKAAADRAAADRVAADRARAQPFEAELARVTTAEALADVQQRATAAGVTLNAGLIDRANTIVAQTQQRAQEALRQTQAQEQQQRQTALNQQFQQQIDQAARSGNLTLTTLSELESQARAAGAQVNTDQLRQGIQSRLDSDFASQLRGAQTRAEFDQIAAAAQAAGANIEPQRERALELVTQREQQAQAQATAAAERTQQTQQYIENLPQPGTEQFNYMVANRFEFTAPDGSRIVAVPGDARSGTAGQYFVSRDQGQTFQDLAGQGPVVPAEQFQQLVQQTYTANQEFQNQQALAQQAADQAQREQLLAQERLTEQQRAQVTQTANQIRNQVIQELNAGTLTAEKLTALSDQATAAGAFIDSNTMALAQQKIAQQAAGTFLDQLGAATTQEQFDQVLAAAEAAGADVSGQREFYQNRLSQQIQQQQAQQQALQRQQAQERRVSEVQAAKTPEQAREIIAQAQAAGEWNINEQVTQGLIGNIERQQEIQRQREQQYQALKTTAGNSFGQLEYTSEVPLSQLDPVLLAQEGSDLNRITQNGQFALQMSDPTRPGFVTPSELARYMRRNDQIVAQRQDTYQFASKLDAPTNFQNRFTPDGVELQGIPDNPLTPENEAGWYAQTPQGMQRIGSDATPQGPVIPDFEQFNQFQQQIRTDSETFRLQQVEQERALAAARMAKDIADFEAKLPSPAEFAATGRSMLRGPDGSNYALTPANAATGAGSEWIRVDPNASSVTKVSSGQTITAGQYNQEFRAVQAANNAVNLQARADRIQDQNELDDFLKVMLVVAVGAYAVHAISSLGALGTTATGGATAGEIGAAASSMAQEGATADEIAAALEASGVDSQVARAAADSAYGLTTGSIDLATAAAESGLSPEIIEAAQTTSDPLAALDASAGWGTADSEYLREIGASDDIINAAEINSQAIAQNNGQPLNQPAAFEPNLRGGTTTDAYGLTVLDEAQTNQLMSSVNPNLINTYQPTPTTTNADLVGYDAAQLAQQGVPASGIEQNLVATGVDPFIAGDAAQLAVQGIGPGAITQNLSAAYGPELLALAGIGLAAAALGGGGGGGAAAGAAAPVAPPAAPVAAPVTPPVTPIAGPVAAPVTPPVAPPVAPVAAPVTPPVVPGVTEAQFIAADAAQLAAQGVPQSQITNILTAGGADAVVAADAAQLAAQGLNSATIAQTIAPTIPTPPVEAVVAPAVPSAPAATTPPVGVTEAEMIAADAAQLAGQGVPPAQIEQILTVSGADPLVAADAAQLAAQGVAPGVIAQNIAPTIPAAPVAPVAPAEVGFIAEQPPTPAPAEVGFIAEQPPTPAPAEGVGFIAEQPPTPPPNAMSGIPGGGVTEAEFVAADAAQLTAQKLTPAQVESTLVASGVEPFAAADAAQLAAQGIGAPAIAQNLGTVYQPGQIITPPPTTGAPVVDRVPDYTNPNPTPDKTLPEALADYGSAVAESALTGNPLGTLNNLAAGATLAGAVLGGQPPAPQRIEYGPIDPTVFGTVTTPNLPGVNPGYFTQVPRQYQTTSPVQAQFSWQPRAAQTGTAFSPQQYQVGGPAVPFGLQQMYDPRAQTIPALLAGVTRASQTAPFNVPAAPRI